MNEKGESKTEDLRENCEKQKLNSTQIEPQVSVKDQERDKKYEGVGWYGFHLQWELVSIRDKRKYEGWYGVMGTSEDE